MLCYFVNQFRLLAILLISEASGLLDLDELTNIQYAVDILDKPLLFNEDTQQESPPGVILSSRYGQQYQCQYEALMSAEGASQAEETLVKTEVVDLLKPMESEPCLVLDAKKTRWWTYKFCYKKEITQYHVEDDKLDGKVISLGRYASEFDWNDSNLKSRPEYVGRYHSQEYTNGSVCDLTGDLRSSSVRFKCVSGTDNAIESVEEPTTCTYIVTIRTNHVCQHPNLKLLSQKKSVPITCQPLLNHTEYNQYLEFHSRKTSYDSSKKKETELTGDQASFSRKGSIVIMAEASEDAVTDDNEVNPGLVGTIVSRLQDAVEKEEERTGGGGRDGEGEDGRNEDDRDPDEDKKSHRKQTSEQDEDDVHQLEDKEFIDASKTEDPDSAADLSNVRSTSQQKSISSKLTESLEKALVSKLIKTLKDFVKEDEKQSKKEVEQEEESGNTDDDDDDKDQEQERLRRNGNIRHEDNKALKGGGKRGQAKVADVPKPPAKLSDASHELKEALEGFLTEVNAEFRSLSHYEDEEEEEQNSADDEEVAGKQERDFVKELERKRKTELSGAQEKNSHPSDRRTAETETAAEESAKHTADEDLGDTEAKEDVITWQGRANQIQQITIDTGMKVRVSQRQKKAEGEAEAEEEEETSGTSKAELANTKSTAPGRKMEVRIINAAYYTKEGKPVSLYADDPNPSIERMVIALLQRNDDEVTEFEKQQRMEENYRFKWSSEKEEETDDDLSLVKN